MPTHGHLVTVARQLKQELNGHAFITKGRIEITEMLRKTSGESTTRIKSTLAGDMTTALVTQGVQVYPPLTETSTSDTVRLYHAGSVLGQLIDTIAHPDEGTNKDLGDVLRKVKGQWNWATDTGPASSSTADDHPNASLHSPQGRIPGTR